MKMRMGSNAVQAFAPGVSPQQAADHLTAALARAGRRVLTRRAMSLQEPRAEPGAGTLHWTVRQLEPGATWVLCIQEGAPSWDLVFLRALSEASDGVVIACDEDESVDRQGHASFLGGRTLEVAASFPGESPVKIGPRTLHQIQAACWIRDVFQWRFAHFLEFSLYREQEYEFETVVSEEWRVTPAEALFSVEEERPASWMLMALTSEEEWRAAGGLSRLSSGWRARALKGQNSFQPYVELYREGLVTPQEFLEVTSRLGCPGLVLSVPGRGEPFDWATAIGPRMTETTGFSPNTEQFAMALAKIALPIMEPPGIVLGRGQEDWETPP